MIPTGLTLSERGELARKFSTPKQRRFGISLRPTTARLRKALQETNLTRRERCLIYDWMLNRRYRS